MYITNWNIMGEEAEYLIDCGFDRGEFPLATPRIVKDAGHYDVTIPYIDITAHTDKSILIELSPFKNTTTTMWIPRSIIREINVPNKTITMHEPTLMKILSSKQ